MTVLGFLIDADVVGEHHLIPNYFCEIILNNVKKKMEA
jgi:hypothetical protein